MMAQQPNTTKRGADDDYSLEAVPTTARKGFWSMFVVMMGFTFFSASMSVGAKLGNGLDFPGFVWAVIIGGIILGAYTGGLAYIGCDTGLTLDLLAQRSFGTSGSKLASVLISFTQIGWFGVGVAMFAIPAAELLGISPFILVLIAGLCMTASAYFGIKALTIVSAISVPLIAVLGVYSMVLSGIEGGGLTAIFAKSAGSLSILGGVGLVIGSFVSGGTATPNFVRFAKNNAVAVSTTVIAFFLGNSLMFAFGAVGGAFTGKDDIFYVMIAQGDRPGAGHPRAYRAGGQYLDHQQQRPVYRRPGPDQYHRSAAKAHGAGIRHHRDAGGHLAVQQLCGLAELPQRHPASGGRHRHAGFRDAPAVLSGGGRSGP